MKFSLKDIGLFCLANTFFVMIGLLVLMIGSGFTPELWQIILGETIFVVGCWVVVLVISTDFKRR